MTQATADGLLLAGPDGSKPLGFLTALGTLRTFALSRPDQQVRLSWTARDAWRPVLHAPDLHDPEELIKALHAALSAAKSHVAFGNLGEDLSVHPDHFRGLAERAAMDASRDDRAGADFFAAFGSDATRNESGDVIQDTAFRTMGGAGHQHFLGFIRNLVRSTTPDHLRKALFEPWRYDDAVEKQTMRWDPLDDIRYALQWRNPSGDPARKKRGSMVGANRLAIEALPLFPTAPVGTRLLTTGFTGLTSRSTFWTWPIWDCRASVEVTRSILALDELQAKRPPRDELARCGIVEIFRSRRLTIGKLRNFAPAESV